MCISLCDLVCSVFAVNFMVNKIFIYRGEMEVLSFSVRSGLFLRRPDLE